MNERSKRSSAMCSRRPAVGSSLRAPVSASSPGSSAPTWL